MPLSDEQRNELVQVIAEYVTLPTLRSVVRSLRYPENFDLIRKSAPGSPREAQLTIAAAVVDAYRGTNRVPQLVMTLLRECWEDEVLVPLLAPFMLCFNGEALGAAQQAALVQRANTMPLKELIQFGLDAQPTICLVVAPVLNPLPGAPTERTGTGFLVAPDVVLTAYHTLSEYIAGGIPVRQAPGNCYVVFDYIAGDQFIRRSLLPDDVRCVEFDSKKWLIDCSADMPSDGQLRNLTAEEIRQAGSSLDFALVRLAEPVGLHERRASGGARRRWVKVPDAFPPLASADRIIIPQHPNGAPQRVDLGRYSEEATRLDTSETRFRYDTETDWGTSGAPCFDQRFRLVGMHNATFMPDGVAINNQGIRIDRILAALSQPIPGMDAAMPVNATAVWSVPAERTNGDAVVLGRQVLLTWIAKAAKESASTHRDRIYSAYLAAPATMEPIEPDQQQKSRVENIGREFTIDILRGARTQKTEPIAVLGARDVAIPDNAQDFLRAIGFQLGISADVLATMPPRPDASLPANTRNADKLNRWISEELPAWFDSVLLRHRLHEVDLRVGAQRRKKLLESEGEPVGESDLQLAAAPAPVMATQSRWTVAWIAIMNLPTTGIDDVLDLLAGLVGARQQETAILSQLRRLRWVFIGETPGFLSADQFTPEDLDPRKINADCIVEGLKRMADSLAFSLEEAAYVPIRELIVQLEEEAPSMQDMRRRLLYLQTKLFPQLRQSIMQHKSGA